MRFRHEPAEFSPARRRLLRLTGIAGLGAFGLIAADGFRYGEAAAAGRGLYEATIADGRAAVLDALAGTGARAISVALVETGRPIWSEAFGHLDAAGRIAASETTLFAVGSISKVVAAVATMILVDRGRIALEAPLVEYVEDFRMASPEFRRITVRMLLNHSAGFAGTDARRLFTTVPVRDYARQVQHSLAAQRLKHPPGAMAVYCNDGFTMIEPLIAAVTGRPYVQFVQEEIFAPLGMGHSRFPLALFPPGTFAPALVDGAQEAQECVNAYASGGLYSTPADLGRMAMMLMGDGQLDGRRILSASAVAALAEDQRARLYAQPAFAAQGGLGWDGVAQRGLSAVGVSALFKDGQTAFCNTQFMLAPEEGLAVVITGSSPAYGAERLAERLLLTALTERGRVGGVPARETFSGGGEAAARGAKAAPLPGFYANNHEVLRVLPAADGTLGVWRSESDGWRPVSTGLKPQADGSITGEGPPEIRYRAADSGGRRYLLCAQPAGMGHYRREEVIGQQVAPRTGLSDAWKRRAGRRWLLANDHPASILMSAGGPIFALHEIAELPGVLVAARMRTIRQIVDPVGDDLRARMCLQIAAKSGSDLNDVVIVRRGGEEWLCYGSLLYRPLETVPVLGMGVHTVKIGAEGIAQWCELPGRGALVLSGATHWKVFDSEFGGHVSQSGAGRVTLSGRGKKTYLLAYGPAGAALELRVMPA